VVARSLGLKFHVLHASTERDFDQAFATLVQVRAGGLVIGNDGVFTAWSKQLAARPGKLRRQFHGPVPGARRLQGEKPADLPVQQITKVELILNLKTAKALGINFPLSLLGRADEVIE
jgi:putative tryptophan/tyrosine transport system substrate-binding protein